MKSILLLTVALLVLAAVGVLTQGGTANAISYACVAPLAGWVIYQVVRALINALW
ncbi:MAG: hypothetical protein ACRYFR_04975 [Janthinobacterium lividum]